VTAVTDPLEAAKITAPPQPPAVQPAASHVKPVEPTPLPLPVAATGIPTASGAKKYRVKKTTTVSLFGQITRLNEGDVVSEESYGPDHMARIVSSGCPLEELS
jgi:hypothetical protein